MKFLWFCAMLSVPDTASYIRGWIQMVLSPNDLFSWNNKYNKYNNYTFTDTFTSFSLSYARQLTLCMLASRSHAGVVILGLLSSSHVFSLPLSGLNWRPLFLPWGSGPSFPNMAAPFTGSAHTPLPGSGALRNLCTCTQSISKLWTLALRAKPNSVLWPIVSNQILNVDSCSFACWYMAIGSCIHGQCLWIHMGYNVYLIVSCSALWPLAKIWILHCGS
jgi:hypothetical protein